MSVNLDNPAGWLLSVISGLKLLAVVIVLEAALTMFRRFCKSRLSILIMLLSVLLLFINQSFYTQMSVLLIAMLIGITNSKIPVERVSIVKMLRTISWLPMLLFTSIFLISLGISQYDSFAGLFATFYKNGSVVFVGGRVVLTLLQTSTSDILTDQQFLFGYAAAQGVPGPMFTMATFMGAKWVDSAPLFGAIWPRWLFFYLDFY